MILRVVLVVKKIGGKISTGCSKSIGGNSSTCGTKSTDVRCITGDSKVVGG